MSCASNALLHMQRTFAPHFQGSEATEVERVICAGRVVQPGGTYADMERIRQGAMRQNLRVNIHAALLSQSGWFVFWAEGPTRPIRSLIEKLRTDPIAHSMQVLHHSRGQRYLLTRWSMMLNPSTEPAEVFGRRVAELERAFAEGRQFPPTSVVRRLAAPLRLHPHSAADPEAFHRVGVCSADNGRAFELVRWLAQKVGRRNESRRVAGERDLDSASEYVEFLEHGQPCRVIAVSRAGLEHGLRRAFLPDWPHLLLLFGDDAKRNNALMERVQNACAQLPATPELLGIAADLSIHQRMAGAARAAQLGYHQLGIIRPERFDDVWHVTSERLHQAGAPVSSQWDLTHPGWTPAASGAR
jgi:hypothetical protein